MQPDLRSLTARNQTTQRLQPVTASRPVWKLASQALGQHVSWQPTLLSFGAAAVAGSGLFGSGYSLEGPGSVAEAIGVLAAIVTVHEFGHFVAARGQGIHVSKFSVGFGPALYKYQGSEVEYSLRAFPLGGFVAFPDDDPSCPYKPDDPNLLKNRSIPERALVISAGVIANCLTAFLVLYIQAVTVGKAELAFQPGVKVPIVNQASAAEQAGLKPGDIILKVGDYEVKAAAGEIEHVIGLIRDSTGRQVQLTLQRGEDVITLPCVPTPGDDGTGRIGVQLSTNGYLRHVKASSLAEGWRMASDEFARLASTVTNGLKQIITNFSKVAGQVSGPVAIVAAGSEIARTDSAGLFQFAAIVNINLAVVNILPLPALDGGYLLLLAIEGVRGKKLPERLEQGVMASGLLLLLVLGVGLVIRDTINLL